MTLNSTVFHSFSAHLPQIQFYYSMPTNTHIMVILLALPGTVRYQLNFWNNMAALNMIESSKSVTVFIIINISYTESLISSAIIIITTEFLSNISPVILLSSFFRFLTAWMNSVIYLNMTYLKPVLGTFHNWSPCVRTEKI